MREANIDIYLINIISCTSGLKHKKLMENEAKSSKCFYCFESLESPGETCRIIFGNCFTDEQYYPFKLRLQSFLVLNSIFSAWKYLDR